ncbi:ADP-ribose pyrophosphatase [hydrothermal vent metagenome]|uniref:ADP-ribose pyrophosphatase n=1 Tax=hydrothermal vent metagenome TaxID=652676 RepID=A0A3B1CD05_9ZZZZ
MNSKDSNQFHGQIIHAGAEQVKLPDGRSMLMDVVRHPGGAAVVALDKARRVCLLRQYRGVMGEWLWELPAGKIDYQESPLETARRELQEEAGVEADSWQELGVSMSSPGVFTERVWLYLARELQGCEQQPEEHEIFELHWLDFNEALDWAKSGKISDAKTVVGLFRAGCYALKIL